MYVITVVAKCCVKFPKTRSSWNLSKVYSNSKNFGSDFTPAFISVSLTLSHKFSHIILKISLKLSLVGVNGLIWIVVKDFPNGCFRQKTSF